MACAERDLKEPRSVSADINIVEAFSAGNEIRKTLLLLGTTDVLTWRQNLGEYDSFETG